jgi:bifunctional NMN adenylyltransferase/nudix hydrolase
MSKEFDFLVYIGRFQPFHLGHLDTVQQALDQADKVIMLVGSSNRSRSIKNSFTYEERKQMIELSVNDPNVIIAPIPDYPYREVEWENHIKNQVEAIAGYHTFKGKEPKIGIIGHEKDDSSYYLNSFPEWPHINPPNYKDINATDIRNSYFTGLTTWKKYVTPKVVSYLDDYFVAFKGEEREWLRQEFSEVFAYRNSWSKSPYPPIFVTVDGVVIRGTEVLMIRRGESPGKGLLALPGGFVEHDQTRVQALTAEMKQETNLDITRNDYNKFVVFDDPGRSSRGRTITHAALIVRSPGIELGEEAGDDAESLEWVQFDELDPREVFEDHYFIIDRLLYGDRK